MVLTHVLLRVLLRFIPVGFKSFLYAQLAKASARCGQEVSAKTYRLPCGLLLKVSSDTTANEAYGLQEAGTIHGIHVPLLIDFASSGVRSYTLMTWIDGDCCENVWQSLTPRDKKRIVSELRTLIGIIRERTAGHTHPICATSGHPISDPRVPWASEDLRTFSSPREFFEQVWLGLDFPHLRNTIAPVIRPLVTREDIPIVFCHGDIYPKNIILPGGLAQWRAGTTSLHLIDWELSGWMPLPWEALKATWLICDHEEDEWYAMMQDVFPESSAELEADWLWRTQSNIPIL